LSRPNPYIVLFIGLCAVSAAAIFIRVAQEENMPSLVIAAGRMSVAALVLTPITLWRYRPELGQLSKRDVLLCILSGVVLGLHFATWISSLEYTSVVASVVLVTTNPLFVALLSFPLLGEKVSRPIVLGIILAFVGGTIVAVSGDAGDPPTRAEPLLGNALAVAGAICAAVYFIIGRRVRARLSIVPYIWLVYGVAAGTLLAMALLRGQSFAGYSTVGYLCLLALGLIPQLVGHSAYNYALGYLPAALVSLTALGESIGSTVLALIFLDEVPELLSVVGSAIILTGIMVASRAPKATVEDVL
jgi:drug/metabolite transporter (DMT)-like permease